MNKLSWNVRPLADMVLFLGAGVSMYYILSNLLVQSRGPGISSRKTANVPLEELRRKNPELIRDLNEYEKEIISHLVAPEDLNVSFKDIGGLESIIDELREGVLYPLTVPQLFQHHSTLLQAPKGVLLYGPPGCGKTMLAKALAAESGASFLNIKMSSIMDKWFGESNKLVAATFSVAYKLQPCIIFIDEIDSFLRERQSTDHEITASIKAEFMTLWDGLINAGRVLVLGATNRPDDIDRAILRRMPKRFAIGLPGTPQRRQILTRILQGTSLDPDLDIDTIVDHMAGHSGSDIKEACRNAALRAMREYIRENFDNGKLKNPAQTIAVRPLRTSDFVNFNDAQSQFQLQVE